MGFLKVVRAVSLPALLILISAALQAAPAERKPVNLSGKTGVVCVILPYDFDSTETEFPNMGLPDNALLVLAGESGAFSPEQFFVAQGGKTYRPVGFLAFYYWGLFYSIWFDSGFNKYQPFEVGAGNAARVSVGAPAIAALKGAAKPVGHRVWDDPVNETSVENTPVIELPDLFARGRGIEYADEALGLRGKGGLAFVRAAAMKALDAKDYGRAAGLTAEALRWSKALEPADVRAISNFQDWVTLARAFKAMGRPPAAVRAYDEALKIRKDKTIQQERDSTARLIGKKIAPTVAPVAQEPYRESLSEAELDLEPHGKIPIPANERGFVREGISADGVFLGDTKGRIRAQCGEPTESFSGMLLYLDNHVCPEAIFFTNMNRAWAIRAVTGKTNKGMSVGDPLSKVVSVYGQPDRKETTPGGAGQKGSVRWIYLKYKIAFVDLTGDEKIDAIDIFDYSIAR